MRLTQWRDIADQLTPTQIGYLEGLEQDSSAGLLATPPQHLALARGWASEILEQYLQVDLAPPTGATEVGPSRKSRAGVRCRSYGSLVTGFAGFDITLRVRGVQYTDGRAEYQLALTGDGLLDLSPDIARDVATALLAAARQ